MMHCISKKPSHELNIWCVLTTSEYRVKICASKMPLSPSVASDTFRSKAAVLYSLIRLLVLLPLLMLFCFALVLSYSTLCLF